MTDQTRPSLLDLQARGGANAREGFRFQTELAIARMPFWLTRSSFIELISEAMGDVEARFFSLEHGTAREFAEYKNHEVTLTEFWHELGRFAELDAAHPGAYFRFTLVCPGVPARLLPIVNALQRLRPAMPFYDDVPTIADASLAEFSAIIEGFGKSANLARFMLARVVIDADPPRSVPQGLERFRTALEEQFPVFGDRGAAAARDAYAALMVLLEGRIGAVVLRRELLDALWSALPTDRPAHDPTIVKTLAAQERRTDVPAEVCLDWSAFSGGGNRTFPPPAIWEAGVRAPLKRIALWIADSGRERRVHLEGQRRLSAALACGAAYCAVDGFTITTDIRAERWSTDAHPAAGAPSYFWQEELLELDAISNAIAVSIGILRNPVGEVAAYLTAAGTRMPMLALTGNEAIGSPAHLNAAVREAKNRIAARGIREIHLFLAVPSQYALFLGHRANSLGRLYCYEFTGRGYAQTCTIEAQ